MKKKIHIIPLGAIIALVFVLILIGFRVFPAGNTSADLPRLDEQEATILAIKRSMPAVVSVAVYDYEKTVSIDLRSGREAAESKQTEKGAGTGFLISADGLILTNRHVIDAGSKASEYRVILDSGKQFQARLIGRDPVNDLAVLKIDGQKLPFLEMGDSDRLQIGASVIAIGNALGRYQNSATKGIVSGLGRSIIASDQSGGVSENLDNVLQTDANISPGNSGGPLIDLEGRVVGINVAIDQAGSAIGFAIPVNDAKVVVKTVRETGRIIRPKIGLRYLMLTPEIAMENRLNRQTGAWVTADERNPAVAAGSPAEKSGLMAGDIIFEINGMKLEGKNTLLAVVQKYKPGQKIGLKIMRGEKILLKELILGEFENMK